MASSLNNGDPSPGVGWFARLDDYGKSVAGPALNALLSLCFLGLILEDFFGVPAERAFALGWCVFAAFLKIAQAINNLAAAVRQWAEESRSRGNSGNN